MECRSGEWGKRLWWKVRFKSKVLVRGGSGFNFRGSREIKLFETRKRKDELWCSKVFKNQRYQSEFVNRRKSGNFLRK